MSKPSEEITEEMKEKILGLIRDNPEDFIRKNDKPYYFLKYERNSFNSAKLYKEITGKTKIDGYYANKQLKKLDFTVCYVPKAKLSEITEKDIKASIKDQFKYENYKNKTGYHFEYKGNEYETIDVVNEAVKKHYNNVEKQKVSPIEATNLLRDLGFKQVYEPKENTKEIHLDKCEEDECIILNKMFTGGYLDIGDNIGHEIINLYEDDNGNVYMYLNSMGNIEEKNLCKTMTVLMVKKYSLPNVLQIIAKVDIKDVVNGATYKNVRSGIKEQQECLDITYGGVKASRIMADNKLPDHDGSNILATFSVKNETIWVPKKNILICGSVDQENTNQEIIPIDGNFPKTSLRAYFYRSKNNKAYQQLKDIISNKDLWETDLSNSSFFKRVDVKEPIKNSDNLLRVSGNEDDELSFSNLLSYFLSDKSLCNDLFKCLGLSDNYYSVSREEYNIDLLVRGKNSLVVIENKIHSCINGKLTSKEDKGKEEKWIEDCFLDDNGDEIDDIERIKKEICGIKGEPSQLEKYYLYAKAQAVKEGFEKTSFLIFCPEYAKSFIDAEKKGLKYGSEYKTVSYKDLYSFFKDYSKNKRPNSINNLYLEEFVKALEKHTKEVDNYREIEMDRRFKNKIFELLNNN